MRRHRLIFALALLAFFGTFARPVSAELTFTVDLGWNGQLRTDHWTPVFVTASDDKPRNVVLEIEWPQSGNYTMHVQQALTIDVTPRTFSLLMPVHGWSYDQGVFTLKDRESGKTLAHYPKDSETPVTVGTNYGDQALPLFGISGLAHPLPTLDRAVQSQAVAGVLDSRQLPESALGFAGIQLLVLNEPSFTPAGFGPPPLTINQQQAIVDWVRAGGHLVIWPGDGGFPRQGPLIDLLPATLGPRENLELSEEDRAAIGVPARVNKVAAFQLLPKPDAQRIALWESGKISVCRSRLGLGRITLAPLNLGELPIGDASKCKLAWQPLLQGVLRFPGSNFRYEPGDTPNTAAGAGNDQGANIASMQIANFLSDVPGAGRIGFSYIAFVLIGMMIVVGPVDWFVLKRIGRQPWTWITTAGWVALITVGAIYAGYLFKSGDLHYRTVRTIDQVGDTTVASTDYVSLYSSRSRDYQIKTPDNSWWQTAGVNEYSHSGMKIDVDFHQDQKGNRPEPMFVNVWSLRFLRGDTIAAGTPRIAADLSVDNTQNNNGLHQHVFGTVTNLSATPLKNLHVMMTDRGQMMKTYRLVVPTNSAGVAEIPPNATVKVDATEAETLETENPGGNRYYEEHAGTPQESELWRSAARLNQERGQRMEALAATGKFAILYAESDHADSSTELVGQKAVERHWEFIRAAVALRTIGNPDTSP